MPDWCDLSGLSTFTLPLCEDSILVMRSDSAKSLLKFSAFGPFLRDPISTHSY